MLKSSSLLVFSIYHNVNKVIKRKKYKDTDLFKLVYPKLYESNSYNKHNCIRIYNDIENNFYTYRDFLITLLYQYIFTNKSIQLKNINEKLIIKTSLLFGKKELEKNKKIVLSINKNTIFNTLQDYFKINKDKESYVYLLIKNKYISPIFWIKYDYLFDENGQKYIESQEHFRFRKICKYIKSHY